MAKKKPTKKPTKRKPAKKKVPAKKKKPAKKKPAKKTPVKRKPAKKKTPAKKPVKKEKKKGIIGSAIGKIPERYKVRGGKAKSVSKSKLGTTTIESEYEDVEVGK